MKRSLIAFGRDAESYTLEACAPVQAGDDTNCSIANRELLDPTMALPMLLKVLMSV